MSSTQKAKASKTVNEIAQEFGVHPTQVSLWKKALLDNASQLFEVKRNSKTIDPDCLYAGAIME